MRLSETEATQWTSNELLRHPEFVWSQPATARIGSRSILPSCVVSNTTPAPSTKLNCFWRPRTKRAAPCGSARSAAAGATTASSRASAASRCRRPDSPSACRGCRPRSPCWASSIRQGVRASRRHRVRRRHRRLSEDGRGTAQREHPRRALSRQSQAILGQQMKYADRRNAPCAIVQGSDEKATRQGADQGSDSGAGLSDIKDRDEYLKRQAEAQDQGPCTASASRASQKFSTAP